MKGNALELAKLDCLMKVCEVLRQFNASIIVEDDETLFVYMEHFGTLDLMESELNKDTHSKMVRRLNHEP